MMLSTNKSRRLLLCRLFVAFIVIIGIVCVALVIVYHNLSPKTPSISLSTLSIFINIVNASDRIIYRYNSSSSVNVTLSIKNPNSMISISYDIDYASTFHNSSFLGDQYSIPSFSQKEGKSTTFSMAMTGNSSYLEENDAELILTQIARGQRVDGIEVTFWSAMTYRSKFRTWKFRLRCECDGVKVAFDSATRGWMTNGPILCNTESYSLE